MIKLYAMKTLFFCLIASGLLQQSLYAADESDMKGVTLPKIIFIWVDTLRADALGFYGNDREVSPNLDRLAKDSYVFMNHHTPHTVTLSSFMSIITGLYPFSHGVLHIAKDKLPTRIKTFTEIIKIYGYSTSWYGPLGDPHLDPEVGFGRGFDKLDTFDSDFGFSEGVSKILTEIEKKQEDLFYINFHTYHVHAPYFPSPRYRYQFTEKKNLGVIVDYEGIEKATVEDIKQAVITREGLPFLILEKETADDIEAADLFVPDYKVSATNLKNFMSERGMLFKFNNIHSLAYMNSIDISNSEVVEYVQALYEASVLEFDTEVIGPLIAKLEELGIYDETMIIVCSDHGEEFGEHNEIGHGMSLYTEVTHVPLMIKPAGLHKHLKIKENSQTVDILPTVFDLIGIDIPYHVQGISFAPFIRGTERVGPRKYIYGQMPYHESITYGDWKLHVFKGYHEISWLPEKMGITLFGKAELFNIIKDPREQVDLYSIKRRNGSHYMNSLTTWKKNLKRYQTEEHEFQENIDEKTKEKIKKTGYW